MFTTIRRIAHQARLRGMVALTISALALSLTVGATASPQGRDAAATDAARTSAAELASTRVGVASPVVVQGKVRTVAEAEAAGFEPFGAADLQDAYNLPSALLGSRQTVAIVSAFDYPTAESDLAAYRESNDLPACSVDFPCFRKLNQQGEQTPLPPSDRAWAQASTIGLQLAAADCPNCRLLLVEADDDTLPNLWAAVDAAVDSGADVVVPMFLSQEDSTFQEGAVHFDHPGVTFVAPSGQDRYGNGIGRQYLPVAYPTVIAVGGTTLSRDDSARGWRESAWSRTSSGCSAYTAKPAWQERGACGEKRTVVDVAAVADPDTPVAIYNTFPYNGWVAVGGTGIPTGFIGGVYGLAGRSGLGAAGERLYRNRRQLFDVTDGSNGVCGGSYLCTARRGYDGPTGLGTPNGIGAF